MATATKLKLNTMLGDYPITKALKAGAVRSDLVDLDFVEVKVANNLFKQVVRDARYDVAELAIVTYLQAKACGKPYVLVPAVLVSRGQHHTIAYNPDRGPLRPSELNGKRVGVRAYTVTTGTWVRRILAGDYGVDINKVEWITFEDPHVAEYRDPAVVKRAPEGKELTQMLLDGEVAAGIVGDKLPDPRLKHLIPDAEAAAQKWAEAPPRRPDQTHAGSEAGAVAFTARRGQGHLPPAAREQAGCRPAGRRRARSLPVRRRGLPAHFGNHHRVLPSAAADTAPHVGG